MNIMNIFRPCTVLIYSINTGIGWDLISAREALPPPPQPSGYLFLCVCLNFAFVKHWQPTSSTCSLGPDRFVLLASGLGLGGTGADSMLGLQLLVDMVTGHLGDEGEQNGAASISRVLLAGNLLSHSTQDKDASTKVRPLRW